MDAVVQLYSSALEKLGEAEARVGAEDEAEVLLSRAISKLPTPQGRSNEEQKQMMCLLQVLLGRVVECKDQPRALECYKCAQEAMPDSPGANLQYARLQWKCGSEEDHMVTTEQRLRDAIKYSERDDDLETRRDAQELLARLLLQAGKREEGHQILQLLGYTHTFATALAAGTPANNEKVAAGATSSAAKLPVAVIDCALGPAMLNLMCKALAHESIFWQENNYRSPRTGFFSFQHKLPPFSDVLNSGKPSEAKKDGKIKCNSSSNNGLELMLHHVWRCAASAVPKVRKARYVEWWAHSRQHCYGHQLHFDSVPGERQGRPRHPIISTVTFLTADCGGPTLMTDQTISNKAVTCGWLVPPTTNRVVCFDGSLLHCVLPGAGAAPSADARRTTFMAAFWEENPHAPSLPPLAKKKMTAAGERERGVLRLAKWGGGGGGGGDGGAKRYKYSSSTANARRWPATFAGPELQDGVLERVLRSGAAPQVNPKAVVHLGAEDIWEGVGGAQEKQKKSSKSSKSSKKRKASDAQALDLMGQGVFTLSEGLLGLGIRADPGAHSY
jgi:hypothetical protein